MRAAETPSENIQQANDNGGLAEPKKKRKKKKKAKRNQTVPSDDGENSDAGIVLKPIAWKTPPASLNGFPGNGRKLEPIRAPLHNSRWNPLTYAGMPIWPQRESIGLWGEGKTW